MKFMTNDKPQVKFRVVNLSMSRLSIKTDYKKVKENSIVITKKIT